MLSLSLETIYIKFNMRNIQFKLLKRTQVHYKLKYFKASLNKLMSKYNISNSSIHIN
jgi:hypothetical protein